MTADEVAAIGLADTAAGRAVSVPGLPNKALVSATSILPRGSCAASPASSSPAEPSSSPSSASFGRLLLADARQSVLRVPGGALRRHVSGSAVFDGGELAELVDAVAGTDLAHRARLRAHDE